jgi:cytochrome c oxidase cbb3-type subunit III
MNSIHFNNGKTLFLSFMAASLLPFTASANNAAAESDGVLMNPMFWVLTGIIVVLAIFIIVLGEVVKNAAAFAKSDKTDNSKAGVILGSLAMLMLLSSDSAMAQTVADAPVNYGGLTSVLFWSMISVIAFEIIMIIFLVVIIRNLLGVEERKAALIAAKEAALAKANKAEPSLFDQFNASVSLDKEEEIMFDHEYDGIRELDNNLPPWWKYGFYVTIIWSVIYVVHYHVTRTGDLSDAEYRNEVVAAEVRIAEYMKTAANLVDETNVKVNTDGETLAKGREVYNANCSACHGKSRRRNCRTQPDR